MKPVLSEPVSIHDVYYDAGLDTTTGQRRYVKAPFQIVKINGVIHVRPKNDMDPTMFGTLAITDDEQTRMAADDLGYYGLPVVVAENELGSITTDNWKSKIAFMRV